LGSDIPNRYDQVSHADGWILTRYRAKVQIYVGLSEDNMEDGRREGVHAGINPNAYSVRRLAWMSRIDEGESSENAFMSYM
jgi:hypothetical protein